MDFTRGSRPSNMVTPESAANITTKSKSRRKNFLGSLSTTWIILLILIAGLILAVVVYIVFDNKQIGSNSAIQKDKYQAVFLTNGQVYFGKITGQNAKTVYLQEIFYLTPTQTVQPNDKDKNKSPDYTLVKLGCELHGPQDLMVIERSQISFWENLKDEGKVVQGIKQFKQQNPNGLNCNAQNQNNNNN